MTLSDNVVVHLVKRDYKCIVNIGGYVKGRKLSSKTRQKAEEHKNCADLAKDKEFFNSAVSRYYYYCLLCAKAYIISNEDCSESFFGGSNSHRTINDNLHRIAKENAKEKYDDVSGELDLLRMSDFRIDADYKGSHCFKKDQQRFSDFLDLVNEFEEAIEAIQ